MIKVLYTTAKERMDLSNLAELFHAKIVDVGKNSLMLRLTGTEEHVEALLQMLDEYIGHMPFTFL